jgi:hypothetical protein
VKLPLLKLRCGGGLGGRISREQLLSFCFPFCPRIFRHSLRFIAICVAALAFMGCAGYQLGPVNGLSAGEKSVQIDPFGNRTLQPRLTDAVTLELRKELQRDGTYQLATHGDPDVIVSGLLTRYKRDEVTVASSDVLTVRDYRLTLTAQVTAKERSTGKVLFDQQVSGYTLIRVGSDLTSSERQAMPLLAGDLAKNITALLAEGKW